MKYICFIKMTVESDKQLSDQILKDLFGVSFDDSNEDFTSFQRKKSSAKKKVDKVAIAGVNSFTDLAVDEHYKFFENLYCEVAPEKMKQGLKRSNAMDSSSSKNGVDLSKVSCLLIDKDDYKSKQQIKKQNKLKKKQNANAGKNWDYMKAPEMTPQIEGDLKLLKLRHVADPKSFRKQEKFAPKHFQVGKVKHSQADWYSQRVHKKDQKSSMIEEMIADKEAAQYRKRKMVEINKKWQQSNGPKRYKKNRLLDKKYKPEKY